MNYRCCAILVLIEAFPDGSALHRTDLWAPHTAAMRLSAAEIMRARDLSKKGNLKRQREYAERTARSLSEKGLHESDCRVA